MRYDVKVSIWGVEKKRGGIAMRNSRKCFVLRVAALLIPPSSSWNCKISATMFELSFIHLWRFRDILVMEFFQIFLSCTFKYVSYVFYEYKFVELEIIINSVDSGISFKVFRRGLWNVSARLSIKIRFGRMESVSACNFIYNRWIMKPIILNSYINFYKAKNGI